MKLILKIPIQDEPFVGPLTCYSLLNSLWCVTTYKSHISYVDFICFFIEVGVIIIDFVVLCLCVHLYFICGRRKAEKDALLKSKGNTVCFNDHNG